MKPLAFQLFALLGTALLSSTAFALPEANLAQERESLMENRDAFFSAGSFTGVEQLRIGFTKFGSSPGRRGCLVISPGQSEASIKYLEVAYDLVKEGFSPVYAIDHRGQGASERLLPDPQKASVKKFSDYATDFEKFVSEVVLADPACRGHHLALLAHSMGGAVVADYLERAGESTPFRKVVLSAPMMKILYPNGLTEDKAIVESWLACALPLVPGYRCNDFAPGTGPFNPHVPFTGNRYTHSQARFDLKIALMQKWPQLSVGGPTIGWGLQSGLADKCLRKAEHAARIAPSVLILQAAEDQVVDNAGEDEFCAGARSCRIERMEGSKHEIFMEADPIRDRAMNLAVRFLTE